MGLEPPHQKSDPQRPTNTNATSAKSKSKAKTKKATSKSRPTSSSHSEDSAWDEANFGAEEARTLAHKADTDDEAEGRYGIQDRRNKRAKKSHRHHRHSRDKDGGDESEEEGAVSDEGPQKRGAGGGGRKTWAEYHSDSDSNSDSESEEVEEIVVKPLSSSGKQQEKRAYWKAKGGDGRDDKEKD